MSRPPARGAGPHVLGAHHPDLSRLRALLRDARRRRAEGAVVLEGARLVGGALDRGARVRRLYVASGGDRGAATSGLEARVAAAGGEVFEVDGRVLGRVASTVTPQPVLAEVDAPPGPPDPWPPPATPESGPVLVLAGVADPGNVGTLVRSAEAAGATAVVRGEGTADPANPKALRASAGAVFGVPIVDAPDTAGVLDRLGRAGWTRVGTVPRGGLGPGSGVLDGAVAIVVGSEAHGLGPDVESRLDEHVSIPMAAGESLNAAVAGSVVLLEAARPHPDPPGAPNPGSARGGSL